MLIMQIIIQCNILIVLLSAQEDRSDRVYEKVRVIVIINFFSKAPKNLPIERQSRDIRKKCCICFALPIKPNWGRGFICL